MPGDSNGSGPLTYAAFTAYMQKFEDNLDRKLADYRTCATCDERHKVIDWLLKSSLTAVVVETIGLLYLIIRIALGGFIK